jgi:FkbM family methyltransferase
MELELKRKFFLEKLESHSLKYKRFNQITEVGLMGKIKRFLSNPEIYLNALKLYFNYLIFKKDECRAKLFWGKEIKFLITKKLPFFAVTGILPGIEEYKLTKFLIKNLKENDIFYDIGANYGFYTYLALEFCKEVHSFEPIPDIINNLKINLINFNNIFLNNLAVSNKNSKIKLYSPKIEKHFFDSRGSSTIIEEALDQHYYKFLNYIEVQTTTLDDYLKNHKPPTVIKMDVEGAEKLVIEGGMNFFKNNAPIIAMEVWPKNNNSEISMQAVNLLRNLGYKSFYIDFDGNLYKIDGDLSEFVAKNKKGLDNFIFKK